MFGTVQTTTSNGFVTSDDLFFLSSVARTLNEKNNSLNAKIEYTGGGIFGLYVAMGGEHHILLGIDGDTLAGDVRQGDEFLEGVTLPVADVLSVDAVVEAISGFVRNAATGCGTAVNA